LIALIVEGDSSSISVADNIAMTAPPNPPLNLRELALQALCEADPTAKVNLVIEMQEAPIFSLPIPIPLVGKLPGKPDRPELAHPAKVPRRSPTTLEGRAATVHAITHIEFNAINLALDALWRFDGMPERFYLDWALVAREEAQHFTLLREHLRGMEIQTDGAPRWDYGDFAAHDGLWEMCDKTAHDIVARMALVPRTLEARGLDATPQIQAKLRQVGTPDALGAVAILDIILKDEIGHVAIGNHWYRWLCERDGLDPAAHYAVLTELYKAPRLRPPFNRVARLRAGFTSEELRVLEANPQNERGSPSKCSAT
jgi:uncharacterized ferritin-like protein (DUF455 family)